MAIYQQTLEKLQGFTLLATETKTAAFDGTGVDLKDYDGDVVVILNATAAGSSKTAVLRLEESADNSTFTAIEGGGFTNVGNAASKQTKVLNRDALKRYIRLSMTSITAEGSTVVTCNGLALNKYG
jgi:hypothetical protein